MVGKTYQTNSLHRKRGLIHMEKDPVGGHWYATKQDVIDYLRAVGCWEDLERKSAIYARVSSHDQKKHGDLDRQIGRLCHKAPSDLLRWGKWAKHRTQRTKQVN